MAKGRGIDWEAVRRRLADSERDIERILSPDAARLRAIMRQRARRLAERRHDGHEAPVIKVLGFRLGEEWCALELTAVAEVLPYRRCTPVPGMPSTLLGVVNLRGRIRPVLDLAAIIGSKRAAAAGEGYILFLRRDNGEIGVRVDQVEAVRALRPDLLLRPGDADGGLSSRFARGIGEDGQLLLDAAAVTDALQEILVPAA